MRLASDFMRLLDGACGLLILFVLLPAAISRKAAALYGDRLFPAVSAAATKLPASPAPRTGLAAIPTARPVEEAETCTETVAGTSGARSHSATATLIVE
jgi:hypothetical protein